ncbi:GNAT family acetyltransferase [Legionella sainthelensi]|uniref:GNAT family N-acetyltransferase n=1 Tax=Legionella sainthelensi TaxID=28087 RepID=UPI000F6B3CA8|nr:GNAT family N-acetyltransferase [Legionella sainthelensi]VEB39585.1 GNAT family acetyltransferase [Legionella sainthelensi]
MIALDRVNKDNQNIISNLLQFYMFELNQRSTFKHFELGQDGKYLQYPYFENYWSEEQRFPYAVQYKGQVIGFSLVHDITLNESIRWKLAEFFIMPEFRRQNIGTEAALTTIKSHPGSWEISVLEDNNPAKIFWLRILKQLSAKYQSYRYQNYEVFEITP